MKGASKERLKVYQDFVIIESALDKYRNHIGNYPCSEIGLTALYQNPGIRLWKGPYISIEHITDPWGMPFKYENNLLNNSPSYIASFGPNGIWDTSLSHIKNRLSKKDDITWYLWETK